MPKSTLFLSLVTVVFVQGLLPAQAKTPIRRSNAHGGNSGHRAVQVAKSCVNGQTPTTGAARPVEGSSGRFEDATYIVERYLEQSEVPGLPKLANELSSAIYDGSTSDSITWGTKAVMDKSMEISKAYSSFYLSHFEALQEVLPNKVDSFSAAEILEVAKSLRVKLKSEIKPLSLGPIHKALMTLKEAFEEELPAHNSKDYQRFFSLFLEQVRDLRLPHFEYVEDELKSVESFFGSKSSQDLVEKLLPILDNISEDIAQLEKESKGQKPEPLPFKEFRRLHQMLVARGTLSQTEKIAELIKKSINGASFELNEVMWEMKLLENQLKDKDLGQLFKGKIMTAAEGVRVASKQFWVPYLLGDLDKMVNNFSNEKTFGLGFIDLESIIKRIADLKIELKSSTEKELSSLKSQEPAENLREASRVVAREIVALRGTISGSKDLDDSLHPNLDSVVPYLYSEKTIPQKGYEILRKLNGISREYKEFLNYARLAEQEAAAAALVGCQE